MPNDLIKIRPNCPFVILVTYFGKSDQTISANQIIVQALPAPVVSSVEDKAPKDVPFGVDDIDLSYARMGLREKIRGML